MPLSCDCYPGCWGVHAEKWPRILLPSSIAREDFYRLVRKVVPYGSYVMVMNGSVHVESEDFRTIVELHLAEVLP